MGLHGIPARTWHEDFSLGLEGFLEESENKSRENVIHPGAGSSTHGYRGRIK